MYNAFEMFFTDFTSSPLRRILMLVCKLPNKVILVLEQYFYKNIFGITWNRLAKTGYPH